MDEPAGGCACEVHDGACPFPDLIGLPAPPGEYFLETMGHRFCLNAPGDFVSTPKITEFVAVGAVNGAHFPLDAHLCVWNQKLASPLGVGCLPVIVLRGPPAGTLPYTRWVDWCEIAVLVSEGTARNSMHRVIDHLRSISAEQADAMRAKLREVVPPSPPPL